MNIHTHTVSQTAEKIEYTSTEEKVMAIMINEINNQDIMKITCFKPIKVAYFIPRERKISLEFLIF